MVGFHPCRDLYFPNQGNGGGIEAEPEEEFEEEMYEHSDSETEVNDQSLAAPMPHPKPQPEFLGLRHCGQKVWEGRAMNKANPFRTMDTAVSIT